MIEHPDYCDGCEHLKKLATLAGHVRCSIYKKNILPFDDVMLTLRKSEGKWGGKIERPQVCKDENKVEVKK